MKAMCKLAEKKGVDIFYETPAVMLDQGADGRVTGVIGEHEGNTSSSKPGKASSLPQATMRMISP